MHDKVTYMRHQMRIAQEPLESTKMCIKILKEVVADQDDFFGDDEAKKKYFMKDWVSHLCKGVVTEIRSDLKKQEFIGYINELPELLAQLMVNNIHDHTLIESLHPFFDSSEKLFQKHFLDTENAILLKRGADQVPEEEKEWRNKIEVGTELDCLKVDPDPDLEEARQWMNCKVIEKTDDNKVKVSFPNDSPKSERTLSIYSPLLAPLGTHAAGDAEWRESLKVGDHVDAYDSTKKWYACTILALETREIAGTEMKSAHIAWRINHPEGDKTDAAGNRFFGWEAAMDDWLPLYSARIQKYQRYTTAALEPQTTEAQTKVPKTGAASADADEEKVDDSLDHLVTHNNGRIFAVHRKACRSDLLVRLVNKLGALGAFEKIIERIESEETAATELVLLAHYIECLSGAGPLFHKSFADSYFERLAKATVAKILRATGPQLRAARRELFDDLLETIYEELLPRVSGKDEADLLQEAHRATVEVGKLFLSQAFLEKRIDGLKLIGGVCTACSEAMAGDSTKKTVAPNAAEAHARHMVTVRDVVQSLTDQGKVLKEVFSRDRTHAQLVSRTEPVLRLLMSMDALSEADRELVWEAGVIHEGEMQGDLLSVLAGAAPGMSNPDRDFLFKKLEQVAPADRVDKHIELVTGICTAIGQTKAHPEALTKGLDFLWSVALDPQSVAGTGLVHRASIGFAEILSRQGMAIKLQFAQKLADALRQNSSGYLVVKILAGLLGKAFVNKSDDPKIANLDDMIAHLEEEHGLLQATVENFQNYMLRVKEKIETEKLELGNKPENEVYVDKFMHSDQITERLEFIRFLASSSKSVRLRADAIDTLWEELATKSPIENDSTLFYTWLRELCDGAIEAQRDPQNVVNVDDLVQFFMQKSEKWLKTEDQFLDMTLAGFFCMQSFIVLVNEVKGNIIKVKSDHGIYQGKHVKAPSTDNSSAKDSGDGKKKMTSFSNDGGGAKTQEYSWNKDKDKKDTKTKDTAVGPVYGPQPKPGTSAAGASTADSKKDEKPEDVEIIMLVAPKQLVGYDVLWKISIENDGKLVVEAAANLLGQVHHRLTHSLQPHIAEYDTMYIEKCFEIIKTRKIALDNRTEEEQKNAYVEYDKLGIAASQVKRLRALPVEDRQIKRGVYLLKQLLRLSDEAGTHDLRPHSSLRKGAFLGCITLANRLLSSGGNKDDTVREKLVMGIDSHATLWELRRQIGEEAVKRSKDGGKTWDFAPPPNSPDGAENQKPVHPATIRLVQSRTANAIPERSNGSTLAELSFQSNETITAYVKSAFREPRAPLVEDDEENDRAVLTSRTKVIVGEIFQQYSVLNASGVRVMDVPRAILYTKVGSGKDVKEDEPTMAEFFEKYGTAGTKEVTAEAFESFFLDACLTQKDQTIRDTLSKLGYRQDLIKIPVAGDPDQILQLRKDKEEMPRYKIAKNQVQFDLLMSLLDGHPEVCKETQELIQRLCTNPILHSKVLALGATQEDESPSRFDWKEIFDPVNVNKMLYSLEIVEAILVSDHQGWKTSDWVKRFLELQGLVELQKRLTEALTTLKTDEGGEKRKYVEQLLRLLRIFVTSARTDPPKEEPAKDDAGKDEPANEEPSKKPDDSQQPTQVKGDTPVGDEGDPEITEDFLFGDSKVDSVIKETKQDTKEESKAKDVDEMNDFEHLQKVLQTDGLKELINQSVDLDSLQDQIIQVLNQFLTQDEFSKEDKQFIENAMNLLQTLLTDTSREIDVDSPQQSFLNSTFFLDGLLKKDNIRIRDIFNKTFQNVCSVQPNIREKLLEIQFKELNQMAKHRMETKHFFELYSKLIVLKLKDEKPDEKVIMAYFEKFVELIKPDETYERQGAYIYDHTLQGLLGLIANVIKESKPYDELKALIHEHVKKSDLINEIVYQCIFYRDGKTRQITVLGKKEGLENTYPKYAVKCTTKPSRTNAYKILNEYHKYLEPHEMADYLENTLYPLVEVVDRPQKWKHSPSNKGRQQEALGIVNLGCICYMISMLQQFFYVPQFRYQLLKAVDETPENLVEYKDEMIDDNFLKQLQKLFGYLELSDRHAYNPKALCFAFKDIDGGPTKIGEQKDSQEFLNFFFDRLECQLQPTSQRYLLKDVFAGNQCSQIICQSCGAVKNRLELFYTLSLQVKDTSGIYESLDRLLKGQVIEDYQCESCNKRANVTKRSILADTPNTLVVHLQRLLFNFDTFMNDKLNSRFEFPTILDLRDYSYKRQMEGNDDPEYNHLKDIDDDDYIYRLVGVNIHVGAADHGHYYSMINVQRGEKEPEANKDDQEFEKWKKTELDPWKKFNDDEVSKFYYEKDMVQEAFGGDPPKAEKADSDAMTEVQLYAFLCEQGQSIGKSAYMLVYERKSKKNLREHSKDENGDDKVTEVNFREVEKYVPDWIQDKVYSDNKTFLMDQQMFNDLFFDHIKMTYRSIASDQVMVSHRYGYDYQVHFRNMKEQCLKVAGKVLLDMLAYFEQNVQIGDISTSLGTIFTFSDSPFSLKSGNESAVNNFIHQYYLTDVCQQFQNIMFTCTDNISRQFIGKITSQAVSRLFKLYAECDQDLRDNNEQVKKVGKTLEQFVNLTLDALKLKECQKNWIKLEPFFKVISDVSTSCLTATQHMLERSDIISDLIDFILGNKSPRAAKETEKRTAMGGTVTPNFRPLFDLISYFIRMVYTNKHDMEEPLEIHKDAKLKLTDHEGHKTYFLTEEAEIMLLKTDIFNKIIFDEKFDDNKQFALAVAHLCYRNMRYTRKITKNLIKCISLSSSDLVSRHLEVIDYLVVIKDEFQDQRLELMFGFGYLMHEIPPGEGKIPQYGVQVPRYKTLNNPYELLSGIGAGRHDEALLMSLWKVKNQYSGFTLACLSCLVDLMVEDEVIAEYFSKLPAPTYNLVRYTDWIRPYLEEEHKDCKGKATEKEKKIEKISKALIKYEEFLKKQAGDQEEQKEGEQFIRGSPQPYAILEAIEEKVLSTTKFGEQGELVEANENGEEPTDGYVELQVTAITCAWKESRPTGQGNLSLSLYQPGGTKKKDKDAAKAGEEQPQDAKKDDAAQVGPDDKSKQEEEPDPYDQIKNENTCSNLLYRISVTNVNTATVKFKLGFVPKCDPKDINLIWPRAGLKEFLPAGGKSHVMTLQKRVPEPDGDGTEIGKLDFDIQWKPRPAATATAAGCFASATDRPAAPAKATSSTGTGSKDAISGRRGGILEPNPTPKAEGGTQTQVEVGATAAAAEASAGGAGGHVMADAGDLPDAPAGMKACPFCTMLNAASASTCEVCGSPI